MNEEDAYLEKMIGVTKLENDDEVDSQETGTTCKKYMAVVELMNDLNFFVKGSSDFEDDFRAAFFEAKKRAKKAALGKIIESEDQPVKMTIGCVEATFVVVDYDSVVGGKTKSSVPMSKRFMRPDEIEEMLKNWKD